MSHPEDNSSTKSAGDPKEQPATLSAVLGASVLLGGLALLLAGGAFLQPEPSQQEARQISACEWACSNPDPLSS